MDGKVVIITGASSGIGAESARQLSRLGCHLTLAARSEEKLTALADELEADALTIKTDVTARDDIDRMVEMTLDRFGRIDVMYANASIYIPGKVDEEGDPEAWSNLMNVNIDGVLNCVHAVLPQMKAQGSGDILVRTPGHRGAHLRPCGGRGSGGALHALAATTRHYPRPGHPAPE